MSLRPLHAIDHFVHIGYDPNHQPNFTQALKARIEYISDQTNHIINFVDEPLYSADEIGLFSIINLVKTIDIFITFYDSGDDNLSKYLDQKAPLIVIYFLKQIVDEIYRNELCNGGMLSTSLDIQNILQEKYFNIILHKCIEQFKGKNIFGEEVSNDMRNDNVSNLSRKHELVEYAHEIVGPSRIIFSGMRDGDWDTFNRYRGGWWDKKRLINFPSLPIGEYIKGNCIDIDDIERGLIMQRLNRYRILFFQSLTSISYKIDKDTQQYLNGEYQNCCVTAYGKILQLYEIPIENIRENKNLCLKS